MSQTRSKPASYAVLHAELEAAGAAEVLVAADDLQVGGRRGSSTLAGVVAAGVVDDDDGVGAVRLGDEAVEHARRAGRPGCR